MKQFVSQEYCLQCDICCRFTENPTAWAPKFTHSEVVKAVEENALPPELFTQANYHAGDTTVFPIQLLDCSGGFRCPCFSVSDNHCLIYHHRPFECRLYPFMLLKKKNQFFVAYDLKCPYITSADKKQFQLYKDYLEEEFKRQAFVSFLKQHRDLFTEYDSADLEILFPIHFDTFGGAKSRLLKRRKSVASRSNPKSNPQAFSLG